MNTYVNLKKVIANEKKTKEELLIIMDIFLMNNRITTEQYDDLMTLISEESK